MSTDQHKEATTMPRKARVVMPDTPHHIIQRGHNRQTVFAHDEDYQYYLENLFEWKKEFDCQIYAWCLMTNHVHLIIQPGGSTEGLSQLMKRLAGRQTRYVNRLEKRTGSLWESRFKSSPIETDAYLLACSRYIELNPVRARMVASPEEYPWSSYRMKIGLQALKGLDFDNCYLALGRTQQQRELQYKDWVRADVSESEVQQIREALQYGHPTGSEKFRDEIETKLGIRLALNKRGRPRKEKHQVNEGVMLYEIH
ncbi:MAG TPA: transposase [Balneolaceae bacterium]|nr:transposase [Balneolaceae bacterium]